MAEMVLLKCETGSKAAVVLCPKCGRISRQILAAPYTPYEEMGLIKVHVCPVCEAKYTKCNPSQAVDWSAAFTRFNLNAYEYNEIVKRKYSHKAASEEKESAVIETDKPNQILKSDSSWVNVFSKSILEIGKSYFEKGRVDVVSKSSYDVSGTVRGNELYYVRFALYNGHVKEMHCTCSLAKSGEKCMHEAAMMYALESSRKQTVVGAAKDSPIHNNTSTRQANSPQNYNYTPMASTLQQVAEKKTEELKKEPLPARSAPRTSPAIKAEQNSDATASYTRINETPGQSLNSIKMSSSVAENANNLPSENLDHKIEYWKSKLLDTGKRNKMINYRETKRSTLNILEPEATELFNHLAFSEKPLTFQKPINKDTDLRTYSIIALMETLSYSLNVQVGDIKTAGTIIEREKTLKNLRSKAKLAQEEQGTNILYLSFGFIYWRTQNKDNSWFKAPLLLMPVSLGLKSLNAPYTLSRYDDEIEVNPTLDYLFSTEYNINLPKFDPKNKDSFVEYLRQIEEIVDKRGWKITRETSLGLLSFLKISMYHDLNNNRERMINHPVLQAMAGDRIALGNIPAVTEHFDFDAVKPDDWHEVVDADSSQEEAILLSKHGVSFVMQGPPGTGKSQTITNIIAEALANGKKVLFVSEKAAALEVVLKRLTEAKLDDFCLSLHNYKANKKEIVDNIGANLSLQPEYLDRTALNELTELFHDRAFLTEYTNELHQIIEPLGESVYMVFGKLSKLEKTSVISFQIEDPKSVSNEQYLSFLYVLDALEKALHNLGGPLTSNPWKDTTVKSSGQIFKQQMLRDTAMLPEKLKELGSKIQTINSEYKTAIGNTWDTLEKSITDINTALNLPIFPYWWTDIAKFESLINTVRQEANEHHSLSVPMQRNRALFSDSVLDAPLDDWINRIKTILDSYRAIGYKKEDVGENYLSAALCNAEETKELLSCLEMLSTQYKNIAGEFGLSEIDSIRNARTANTILDFLNRRPSFHEKVWFRAANNEAALKLIDEASEHASRLKQFTNAVATTWSETVLGLDLSDMTTFFGQNAWMYADASETDSIEGRISTYQKNAEDLQNKIIPLVEAYTKSTEMLGVKRADNLEDLRTISVLLNKITDVPYLETGWFDVRKNEAAHSLLEEALTHYTRITEQANNILQKWEPEALNMEEEALAMLGRFKTQHVGAFHRMKAEYKEDIKKIRLLSKEVGKSIEESEAIAFLQSLKELRDEKQWYKENEDLLTTMAGSYYRGANTDWESVKRGMAFAAEIANSFPYANIPENVITAIQRASNSIQDAAEIKELAATLSEEKLAECDALLKDADYVEQTYIDDSLHQLVLPQIQEFFESCAAQRDRINCLQAHHVSSEKVTVKELEELLANKKELQNEEKWFLENSGRFETLLASKNHGSESNFEEIRKGLIFAKEVIDFFPNTIPDTVISVLCKDEIPSISAFAIKHLSSDVIDGLIQKLHSIASYSISETESLYGTVIPKISAWITNTRGLESLISEIRPYCISDDLYPEQYLSALPIAAQTKDLRNQVLKKDAGIANLLGDKYQGINTDWEKIENEIQQVKEYLNAYKPSITHKFVEIICDSEELRTKVRNAVEELQSIFDEAHEPYQIFKSYFKGEEKFGSVEFDILTERYDRCLNGFGELNKWLDYVEARADCDSKGLASFTAAIAQKNNSIEDVKDAFERGFYMQWLSAVIDDVPAVQSFRRRVHEQRAERFITLDTEQLDISKKRIRGEIIKRFPDTNGVMRAGSELHILTHEMEKRRRIMPLRKLFQSIPNLLLTLKPCLMMSPLSVAYFLDADKYHFNMVIFDEASQIFPQDAIGAIFRADQVIIAGDTNQLPPTNFFAASTSNSSEGYDDDEGYDDEIYDSILEETTNVLTNRKLLWHYRSKHEHLIAFSNQEIYRNELITFPSSNESEPDTGVEFEYVEEGYYEPSPKNYNTMEAMRCVQLVKEHIDKHPKRSLGIIAFSEKQQQEIALEIQKFREKNPEYEEFFTEGKEDEFFVKNLENVQGDERDTIFFSVGYARTKEQKANGKPMSMRFGPLGLQGGERRLNVAITRAKINVKLISSILPSDIDLSKTESEGIRMLRSYIEFAMNGDATLSAAHKINKPDIFADAIAQFIRDHGFKVRQYVGCSGYKIDIAVQHPSEVIEQFVAGIECDGFSYASAKTARDRDRLRSTVLKKMGWNLYRVWSTEWHKNPEIEGQKLIEFINKAIADCDEKVKILEEEKRRAQEAEQRRREQEKVEREVEEQRKQREQEEKVVREEAERKRREAEKKRAEKQRTEQEAARKREEDRRKAEEGRCRESEAKQITSDLSWVKLGARVYHSSFHMGTVTEIRKDTIKVRFGKTERTMSYPIVFESGILSKPVEVPEKPKAKGPDWATVGTTISHKNFGEGVIANIEGGLIKVRFKDALKTFAYPDAFTTGFLTKGSNNQQPEQIDLFSESSKQETRKESKAQSAEHPYPFRLLNELKTAGFTVIDNRMTSSIIWVIYVAGKKQTFERIAQKYNVQYSLERRGALATRNVPAWRIMINS